MEPAVYYIRMSTGKEEQKDSPATQRKECELVRNRGNYDFKGEYVDEGKSGNSFNERPGLQRMIADARAGKFKVIIVDKRERLSRQDHEEWATKMVPWLRETKMKIHSAVEGLADYSKKDFARSLQDQLHAIRCKSAVGKHRVQHRAWKQERRRARLSPCRNSRWLRQLAHRSN